MFAGAVSLITANKFSQAELSLDIHQEKRVVSGMFL